MHRISRARALAVGSAAVLAAPFHSVFADDVPIRFGGTTGSATAEFFYADQLGYFKRAGLDVQIQRFSRTPDVLDAIVTGSLEIGLSNAETISNAMIHGLPVRAIGTGSIFGPPPPQFGLYVAKDSPIHDARGLQGGILGVSVLNDIQSLAVWAWLDKAGVPSRSIQPIEVPFPTMATALEKGTIQAATLAEPFISAAGDNVREIPGVFQVLGNRFAIQAFYTSLEFGRKHPDLIAKLMQQIYAIAKVANSKADTLDALLATWTNITPDMARSISKPLFAESMNEAQFSTQLVLAAKYKVIPRSVSFKELTSF